MSTTNGTFTPYTYIQCPCTSSSSPPSSQPNTPIISTPTSPLDNASDGSAGEDTFDPRSSVAPYSLYSLEHLYYCEDCHQIRCPRCVLDEVVTFYCPNCLFEVPGSGVRAEGNRCTRSCFQCPLCISPLSVTSAEAPSATSTSSSATQHSPYILSCGYCSWSSKDIGIQFEKPNAIFGQLARIANGGATIPTLKERKKAGEDKKKTDKGSPVSDTQSSTSTLEAEEKLDPENHFASLKSFYQSQLAEASPSSALGFTGGDYGYGSPGALTRIMGLYTSSSAFDKKTKSKTAQMREASTSLEGLQFPSLSSEEAALSNLQNEGYEATATASQRSEFPNNNAQFTSDLRPIAYLLRTKRSKRCRTCRHILSKPESKVQTTRFRIRLVALNYVPSMSIKPLQTSTSSSSLALTGLLQPLRPVQFLLTFKNPLFDRVKVSLATPSKTPGRFGSGITVLCPQFEVGANTDAWEEALKIEGKGEGGLKRDSGSEKRRTRAEVSEGQGAAEAGKVWERGRNWCSIVVEVVPASLREITTGILKAGGGEGKGKEGGGERIKEDEDVCEIPVFVRVEWEADVSHEEGHGLGLGGGKEREGRERRELAYWCVLGVGRIARD